MMPQPIRKDDHRRSARLVLLLTKTPTEHRRHAERVKKPFGALSIVRRSGCLGSSRSWTSTTWDPSFVEAFDYPGV